jgi:hypothetical protein
MDDQEGYLGREEIIMAWGLERYLNERTSAWLSRPPPFRSCDCHSLGA